MTDDKSAAAVIGAGAIGGYLAAMLADAGRDVTLCVRTPFEQLSIAIDGTARDVQATIASDPSQAKPVGLVVVATKAQDTASAAGWLSALVGPDSRVLVAQNGIEHRERLEPLLDGVTGVRVVPAIVYIGAERTEPGHVVHHGSSRLIVADDADGRAVAAAFEGSALTVETTADFTTAAWKKLFANIVANPVTALTMRRMDVFEAPATRDLARALLTEAVAVGRAAGAQLSDEDAADVVARFDRIESASGSSMLYDRLSGRSLEYEELTGALLRAADRHGVEAPLNRAIYALLQALNGSSEWRR